MNLNKSQDEENDQQVESIENIQNEDSADGSKQEIKKDETIVLSEMELGLVEMVMYFNVSVVDASEK